MEGFSTTNRIVRKLMAGVGVALGSLMLSVALSILFTNILALAAPTQAPPNANPDLPLNRLINTQTKQGPLMVNNEIDATGFYDYDDLVNGSRYYLCPGCTPKSGQFNGILCMGQGQGTNAAATCGPGSQSLHQLKALQDPTDPQDVATMNYVQKCLTQNQC